MSTEEIRPEENTTEEVVKETTEVKEEVKSEKVVEEVDDGVGEPVVSPEEEFGISTEEILKTLVLGKADDKQITVEDMDTLLAQMRQMIGVLEVMWENYRKMYQLTDKHIKALTEYNLEKRVPEDQVELKEGEKYDYYNGFDFLTEEDLEKLFPEGCELISRDLDQNIKLPETIKTIKDVIEAFFSWVSAVKEYKSVYDNYMQLVEEKEEASMKILKEKIEAETDEEKKAKLAQAFDFYTSIKTLKFLTDPEELEQMDYVLKVYKDKSKVKYLVERGKDKLKQLGIDPKFILEMSKFEIRFLDQKYHEQYNILLTYFLSKVVYGSTKDSKSSDKLKIISFVIALDRLIRNRLDEQKKTEILENIVKFEEAYYESTKKVLAQIKEEASK